MGSNGSKRLGTAWKSFRKPVAEPVCALVNLGETVLVEVVKVVAEGVLDDVCQAHQAIEEHRHHSAATPA